jgi:hypothetical protein
VHTRTTGEFAQLRDSRIRVGLAVHQADDDGVVTTARAFEHLLLHQNARTRLEAGCDED